MPGSGCSPAARSACARAACRAWAGPEVDGGGAFYFAHSYAAETPCATAWSEGVVAEARVGLVLRLSVPPGEERRARARATSRSRWRLIPLPRLIPCLDVAGGRVVKGVRFQGLRDVGDPVELGAAYSDARRRRARVPRREGDARGARRRWSRSSPRSPTGSRSRSRSAAACAVAEDGEELLAAGADKVAVNSAALDAPGARDRARRRGSARRRSSSRSTPSRDGCARGRARPRPAAPRSTGRARPRQRGAGEILLTSIDADGTRAGYDLELTAAVSDAVDLPVIASGGAGNARHVAEAFEVAQAALLASILHEDPDRLASLRGELRELGVPLAMTLRPAIVQDAATRPRADARLDERRGRAAARARPARPGSGAARASSSGARARRRATRSRSRSCATTATATRCSCA